MKCGLFGMNFSKNKVHITDLYPEFNIHPNKDHQNKNS